jgi:hypothetical protein
MEQIGTLTLKLLLYMGLIASVPRDDLDLLKD